MGFVSSKRTRYTSSWRNNNIYIVYERTDTFNVSSYPALKTYWFGAVTLTISSDIDKHGHSRYGIGFDSYGSFSFSGTELGRNVIMFRVDVS